MSSIFAWRGRDISRLEGFSDAVFGFGLTLLVVSLEVPSSYAELIATMSGFFAFACCFAIVIWIWYEHNLFFRRFGMQDGFTVFLNSVLLFVILFYVYPLKFVFSLVAAGLGLGMGPASRMIVDRSQSSTLMVVYGIGFVIIFLVLILLYHHAFRKRAALQLSALEIHDAATGMKRHLLSACVGLLSITIVLAGGNPAIAGMSYGLLGPVHAAGGYRWGKRRVELEKQIQQQAAQSPGSGAL